MRAIVAVNNLGFIGLNGGLPWKCKEDLRHFKNLTYGGNLLGGYNTFLTLPELKGRLVIPDKRELSEVVKLWIKSCPDLICIGGKLTYEKYCHLFTELHISHISDDTIGDTLYPDFLKLNPDCKIFHYYFEVDK